MAGRMVQSEIRLGPLRPASPPPELARDGVVERDRAEENATGGLPEEPSDADLGIGQQDNEIGPQIEALVEAAVRKRLAELGAAPPDPNNATMMALVTAIERSTSVHAAQLPGYHKPLPADEIDRRAQGFVDMQALIDKARRDGDELRYRLVGQPLFAGEIEYRPGSEIVTFLYPNEHMQPLTKAATAVHRAFMQWIGGPQQGIAERVYEAEIERRQRGQIPGTTPFQRAGLPENSPVQIVADPPEERKFDPRSPPQAAHEIATSAQPYRID